MNLNFAEWGQFFKFTKQFCIQNKLEKFHYKFLHRIMVIKKELCRSGIKQDNYCLYCGNEDSIKHSLINCQLSKPF